MKKQLILFQTLALINGSVSILMKALSHGSANVAKLLLERRASVGGWDEYGSFAIH